jgi:hypothetical protein
LDAVEEGDEDDDDDEFFDVPSDNNNDISLDGWDDAPDLDLSTQYLLYSDTSIIVPETQDNGMMTEDMLVEQQRMFQALGTGEEAQRIRARLQTASLSSGV